MKLIRCCGCTNWALMHKLAGRSCMNMLGSHACAKWVLMHERIGCSCVKELVWEAIWACCAHVGHAGSCGSFPWQLEQRCPGVDGAGGGCLGSPYRRPPLWVPLRGCRGGCMARRRFRPPKQKLVKLQATIPKRGLSHALGCPSP